MITTETIAWGYRSLQRTHEAIENMLAEDFLSLCEKPRPRLYKNRDGERRYKVVVDVDHGHFDPTTELAGC